jgi:4-alpha-glucanotransferase
MPDPALFELARLAGIQTDYIDMAKRRRRASPETLLAVLRTLGVTLGSVGEAPETLRRLRTERAQQRLEPVQVIWRGEARSVVLRIPESEVNRPWRVRWRLEDGTELAQDHRALERWAGPLERVEGRNWHRVRLPLPRALPDGYHTLTCEGADGRWGGQVIRAPLRVYAPPGGRCDWGLFAPLYALRSERNLGIGDFTDWEEFLAWTAKQGGRLVGTLPLLPAFLEEPCEPSPYSPVTRLGWNEVFLDLEKVPELAACPQAMARLQRPAFRAAVAAWRREPLVRYREVMREKRAVLELLADRFFRGTSVRRAQYDRFLAEHPWVTDYARFRAVMEKRGEPWQDWPERLRRGVLRAGDGGRRGERLHGYAQWLAHEQIGAVAAQARRLGVSLYLDIPLGTHREGYDAWRQQRLFALEASGGSPPDPVFTQGQDWGFAPIHPERSRAEGHAYLRAYLRHHLELADLLRLDHVMGLHRLYWVPRGMPASAGAYVTYPAEEFYAILSLESHRHRAVIVGENLGTVPPEVERGLARHGVCGMYVAQYEFRAPPRRPLRPVPERVLASVNTHDMPPFHAWWQGLDLADRRELGLLSPAEERRERQERSRIRRWLSKGLPSQGALAENRAPVGDVLERLLARLASSRARFFLLNIEDLWLETEPQNVPGTGEERINWRRKLRYGLGDGDGGEDWLRRLRVVAGRRPPAERRRRG